MAVGNSTATLQFKKGPLLFCLAFCGLLAALNSQTTVARSCLRYPSACLERRRFAGDRNDQETGVAGRSWHFHFEFGHGNGHFRASKAVGLAGIGRNVQLVAAYREVQPSER